VTSTIAPLGSSLVEQRPQPDAPALGVLSRPAEFDAPPARTLVDIFTSTVARWPEHVALEDSERALTYRQLADEIGWVADRLRASGIGRGDRVGIRVQSGTVDLYIAVLGTLLSGAAYVPVDAADPAPRAQLLFQQVDACAVITDKLEIGLEHPGQGRTGNPVLSDDCWVIFTSGSTGAPKGVAVSHRAAAAFVDAESGLWRVETDDRVLAGLSVGFDASCEEMWLAWRSGAALVACPRSVVQSGVDLGPWLAQRGITVVSTVPTLAAMWDDEVLAKVRLLILGGEACSNELGWRLAGNREVWNTYGPTEATVVSTAARVRPDRPVTIGRPLRGWDAGVIDALGRPVPTGEVGELVIAGVGLGRYLDPELDRCRYAGIPAVGWDRAYHTGDMVRQGPDGLEFLGRRDDQVKIGGRRIELGEIDAQLRAVPGVRAAAATVQETACQNPILVGYVVGDVDVAAVRSQLGRALPEGIVPRVIRVDSLPLQSSGKVDRRALPWPMPAEDEPVDGPTAPGPGALTGTARWLAERWAEQLGPSTMTRESDFFSLGATSLAVAKLVSVLRSRFPSVAVADVYQHRSLGELADRLVQLKGSESIPSASALGDHRWGLVQILGVVALIGFGSLQWLLGLLAFNQWAGVGPRIGWVALLVGWLVISSPPGRAAIVATARRTLLGRLRPGRYPREGWVSWRLWFVHRLGEAMHLESVAGTPWAARYARMCGVEVGPGARLGTLPPPSCLLQIGAGATLEGDVDVCGWWLEGHELVVGEIRIGAGARIGTRCLLMPGADIGAGAELEPGSVVTGTVPPGERWSGSPAAPDGLAGDTWPAEPHDGATTPRSIRMLFGCGLGVLSLLPVLAALPSMGMLAALGDLASWHSVVHSSLLYAPVIAVLFVATYALLVAACWRAVSWMIKPGWHPTSSMTAWALWFTQAVMAQSRVLLFPLYSSVYTRSWLRLLGIRVGKRTEVSTAVGLNALVSIGDTSFVADDVIFVGTRSRGGLLEVSPITVGTRSFLGNGAILRGHTVLGDDSLVGVLSSPPLSSADGTSWLGLPALELPRIAECPDPSRTTTPPRRLVVARGAVELVRILLPASVSVVLGALVFLALEAIGSAGGVGWLIVAAPFLLAAAGVCAVGLTVGAKWLLMGRYRAGEHPLWSFFVWRDELINTLQEDLAAPWLLSTALGTPLLSAYLRAMGSRVGKGVWCDSLALTEFDLVDLGEGCVVNRWACVETHLFHDRVLRMGPAVVGARATIGPYSAVLPNSTLGCGSSVGGRSVVLRGEQLPPHTRWHGSPVQSVCSTP
jgi:non-ribosomal peptide synthetase-like protein